MLHVMGPGTHTDGLFIRHEPFFITPHKAFVFITAIISRQPFLPSFQMAINELRQISDGDSLVSHNSTTALLDIATCQQQCRVTGHEPMLLALQRETWSGSDGKVTRGQPYCKCSNWILKGALAWQISLTLKL